MNMITMTTTTTRKTTTMKPTTKQPKWLWYSSRHVLFANTNWITCGMPIWNNTQKSPCRIYRVQGLHKFKVFVVVVTTHHHWRQNKAMAHKKMLKTYQMKKPPYLSQLLQVVKYAHKKKINYWYQGNMIMNVWY